VEVIPKSRIVNKAGIRLHNVVELFWSEVVPEMMNEICYGTIHSDTIEG
jgi:hypothetical protein